ncbi:hypothetical protein CHLRE_13g564850v5 [Chlamydomonas reinhardtii]|uniref:Auxin efflux carrier n=1 Tax=Chlamydomonas reinhardtii TaxID=3055 RepID=A0A2K3CZ68_CHLRE|nr:uncharacterized protein CHLRE_13g564850v5 [Chlamydomonas reinhardtii]PNW73583.1 hypothetical protein CHLRE_13g564850v5 [Chlamydomonas reinhardtii]
MRQLRSPGLVVLAGPPQSSPCACTQHRCSRAAAWGGWRRRPQSTTAASAFAAAGAADTAVTKATGYTSLSVSARRACHTLRALPAGGAPVALAAASLATATATPTAAGVPGGAASLSQLVVAAAQPVAKLALFCAVGAWASRQGLLTADGRRVISTLTLHIFTPCLLFSKLATGVGLAEVARLWVVSWNMVFSHVVGLLLGLAAARLLGVPARLQPHLVLACGVGNVGNMPFILCASLAADTALPFAAALGATLATELALRYVALSNFIATLIQFPLAYIFLYKPPQLQPPASATAAAADGASSSAGGGSSSTGGKDSGSSQPQQQPLWRTVLSGMLTPPTVASLAAVLVASVPVVRDALYASGGSLVLVGEVVESLGAVCIPALLLVLGANLGRGPGVAAGRLPAAAVVAAVVTRLLAVPLVCGALLWGAWSAGLLPGCDPLSLLVMLVMHTTPTAVMVHSMASIFNNAEDEVAVLLFWQYLASLITLPLAISWVLKMLTPVAAAPGAWSGSAGAAAAAGAVAAAAAAAAG